MKAVTTFPVRRKDNPDFVRFTLGTIWEITPGEDFVGDYKRFQSRAYGYAASRNLRMRSAYIDHKLYLQFTKK